MAINQEYILEIEKQMDTEIKPRIVNPTVKYLYDAYKNHGVLHTLAEILSCIDPLNLLPITHTLTSHITKEKPLFVYAVGKSLDLPVEGIKHLAADVDLLWGLSLIVDDIEDGDDKRAGKSSTWVEFGKSQSLKSARSGLAVVYEDVRSFFGESAQQAVIQSINSGLSSIEEHKVLDMEVTNAQLKANYQKRAQFHAQTPFEILYTSTGLPIDRNVFEAMRDVNLAGQILNDVKDLIPTFRWLRPSWTDFRSGLVTVPLKLLWDRLSIVDQDFFMNSFGTGHKDGEVEDLLLQRLRKTGALTTLRRNLRKLYLDSMKKYFSSIKDEELKSFFQIWCGYKLEQVGELR